MRIRESAVRMSNCNIKIADYLDYVIISGFPVQYFMSHCTVSVTMSVRLGDITTYVKNYAYNTVPDTINAHLSRNSFKY